MPPTRSEIWAAVDGQRHRTIALLDSLSPHEWDGPTLCTEWTVKDLAGHLVWQRDASYLSGLPAVVAAMVRSRGDIARTTCDLAKRWASARSVEQLRTDVRGLPGHHRHVIGTTDINHLIDAIVHTHDIGIPLGRELDADPAAAALAADSTWSMPKGYTLPPTRRLVAFRWRATDIDWDRGDGPLIEGPMAAILCLLTGRGGASRFLAGPGLDAAVAAAAPQPGE